MKESTLIHYGVDLFQQDTTEMLMVKVNDHGVCRKGGKTNNEKSVLCAYMAIDYRAAAQLITLCL
jgi:hypothetical protein